MAWIYSNHQLDNTSDKWLVVGNYHQVISSHGTKEAAVAAAGKIGHAGSDGLAETPWARVAVVAPGETIRGELSQMVVEQDEEGALPFLGEMFAISIDEARDLCR